MGMASSGLDLIRRVFQRDLAHPRGAGAPFSPYVRDVNFATHQQQGAGQGGSMALASSYEGIRETLTIEQEYEARLVDYAEMDNYPEISATLDLAADDATVQNVIDGNILWYEAPDEVVAEILNNMLEQQIRVSEDIWGLTRNICKFGNAFTEIVARDKVGVMELRELPADHMRRIQDRQGILYGYLYDMNKAFGASTAQFQQSLNQRAEYAGQTISYAGYSNEVMVQAFEPWEMVHFRMMGSAVGDPYGKALTDSARYIWRRLQMMEDSMLVYKLSRSAQRYAFYVDVGDIPPREARKMLAQVRDELKKKKSVDSSGKLQLRYDVLSPDEDFFMAVRKGSRATEVEVLSAPEGQQVDDVNYFREKLFAALKVPKSYLGGDDTVGRANLSQLDVRWARTVMRIQNVTKQGFRQVGRVELACRNIDPDRVEFNPMMNVPSGVLELAQLEVQNAKLDLSERYQRASFSEYWVWSNVLGLSDDDIEAIQKQRMTEQGGAAVTEDVRRAIQRDINKARDRDKTNGIDKHKSRVLDEVAAGRTEFSKKIKEIKLLVNDVRAAMGRVERRQKRA